MPALNTRNIAIALLSMAAFPCAIFLSHPMLVPFSELGIAATAWCLIRCSAKDRVYSPVRITARG
jgi:hypothetical protein